MTKIRCTQGTTPKNGLDAAYPYVSTGSILMTGDSYGTITDYSDAKSIFRFYAAGVEQDLSSAVITVKLSSIRISYTLTNEVGGLGKVLSITQFATTYYQEWIDLSYIYNGVTYTKRVNLAKVKDGLLGNQLVFNDSTIYNIAVGSTNPYSHSMSGLALMTGDIIKASFSLSSIAPYTITFNVNGATFDMNLGISAAPNFGICEINLHIINYNISSGELDYMIMASGESIDTSTSDSVSYFRWNQLYTSTGIQQAFLTIGSPVVTIGISTNQTTTALLRNFNVEYKRNYNNTLFQW